MNGPAGRPPWYTAPALVFAVLLLLGAGKLLTGSAHIPWDATALYLTWKHHITECLWNGLLPLWNPYINGGFPQQGDPGTWYPVSWLFALKGRYDLGAMHAEYLFHLWFAAMGAFLLLRRTGVPHGGSLGLGACYMFSGLMIGNAQHIGWVVSAAWLPWILLAMLALYQRPRPAMAAALAMALAMSLAGGYAAMFIVLAYLLVVLCVLGVVRRLRQGRQRELNAWFLHLGLAGLLFLPAAAAVLASSFELAAHVNRGRALEISTAVDGILDGALPPKALITLLMPTLTGVRDPGYWSADITFVNSYIGLLPLIFLLVPLLRPGPGRWRHLLLVSGAMLAFAMAMAQDLPLRVWLYHMPFMGHFRNATLFRMFAILFLLLAAGLGWSRARSDPKARSWIAALSGTGALAMVVTILVQWQPGTAAALTSIPQRGVEAFLASASVADRIVLSATTSTLFLALTALVVRKENSFRWALPVLMALEVTLAARVCGPDTAFHHGSTREIAEFLEGCPTGYPLPPVDRPMSDVNDEALRNDMLLLWKNLAMFHKLPTGDGYTPYRLEGFAAAHAIHGEGLFDGPVLEWMPSPPTDGPDTGSVHMLRAHPGLFDAEVRTNSDGRLILRQHTYPGWRVTVDGERREFDAYQGTFMAVSLPAGTHHVSWRFGSRPVMAAARISMATWVLLLLWVAWACFIRPGPRRPRMVLVGSVLLGLAGWTMVAAVHRRGDGNVAERWNGLVADASAHFGDAPVLWVANTDRREAIVGHPAGAGTHVVRTALPGDLGQLGNVLAGGPTKVAYLRSGSMALPEEDLLLNAHLRPVRVERRGGITTMLLEQRGPEDGPHHPKAAIALPADGLPIEAGAGFGPALRIKVADLPAFPRMVFHVRAGPVEGKGPLLVMAVDRAGTDVFWHKVEMGKFGNGPMVDAFAILYPPWDLRPGDEVVSYLWDPESRPFTLLHHEVRW